MKKNVFIIFLLSLSILLVSLGSTNASTLRERATNKISENKDLKEEAEEVVTATSERVLTEENAKEKFNDTIKIAIDLLKDAEDSINASYLSQETKNEANKMIDETITVLEDFQSQVNNAESMEDVLKITQQAKEYALSQKDDLKLLFEKVQQEIGEITMEEISYAIDELDQALSLLKIVCPKQIDQINTIQGNLDDLEVLLISMDTAIKNENYTEVARLVKESNEMLVESALAIEAIMENPCIY